MKDVLIRKEFVLLELLEEDTHTESGLVMAHSKGERTESWAVKAKVVVGEDEGLFAAGDTVYVSKWEIHHVFVKGKKLAVAKTKDIMLSISQNAS